MVLTPCTADPSSYALEGSVPAAELIEACMHCPVLAQCRADYTADPTGKYGVIAGLYRPYPVNDRDGMQISEQKWEHVLGWILAFCDTTEAGTPLPNVSDLAKATGVHRWACNLALQEAEARGLITPACRKSRTHYRYTQPVPGAELEEAEAS